MNFNLLTVYVNRAACLGNMQNCSTIFSRFYISGIFIRPHLQQEETYWLAELKDGRALLIQSGPSVTHSNSENDFEISSSFCVLLLS